jgi:Protein of unknown function (DUF3631)
MALRWAQDNTQALIDADAKDATRVPPQLNDRAADNWRPLQGIADTAGGRWSELARAAALALSGVEAVDSIGVQLLRDILGAFQRRDEQGNIILELDEIKTEDLLAHLMADPERPWADYRRGRALSAKQLGALLGRFGIGSEKVQGVRGYKQVRFMDAWGRYLPPDFSPNAGSDSGANIIPAAQVALSKCPSVPNPTATGNSAIFQSVPEGGSGRIENSEKPPSIQRSGHLDALKPPTRPESMKGRSSARSTAAELRQAAGSNDKNGEPVALGGTKRKSAQTPLPLFAEVDGPGHGPDAPPSTGPAGWRARI